jgi:hypothetical protein
MRPWDFWRHRMADGCLLAWRASAASQFRIQVDLQRIAPFKQEEQLETWELWENVMSNVIYSMLEIWFRLFGGGRTTNYSVVETQSLDKPWTLVLLFNCTMRFYVLSPAMCRSPSAFINHFLDPEVLPSHFQGSLTRWTLTMCCLQCCHGCQKKYIAELFHDKSCRIFLQSNIVKPIWFKAVLGGDTTPHRFFCAKFQAWSGSQGIL